MQEFRIKVNIKLDAEDMAEAFSHLAALAVNRANIIGSDEDFTPDPEPDFTGEIDVHPMADENPLTGETFTDHPGRMTS